MVIVLPLDVADHAADVAAVSGMMLGVGYSPTALAPFSLGAFRDATGSFALSLWLVVALAAVLAAVTASGTFPSSARKTS
jgi:cyanate permease